MISGNAITVILPGGFFWLVLPDVRIYPYMYEFFECIRICVWIFRIIRIFCRDLTNRLFLLSIIMDDYNRLKTDK